MKTNADIEKALRELANERSKVVTRLNSKKTHAQAVKELERIDLDLEILQAQLAIRELTEGQRK